jgi:hypothetical protein
MSPRRGNMWKERGNKRVVARTTDVTYACRRCNVPEEVRERCQNGLCKTRCPKRGRWSEIKRIEEKVVWGDGKVKVGPAGAEAETYQLQIHAKTE